MRVLVTAGNTREKIDDVRDWGNIFTGQTGLDIALAFLDLGHVTLLTSNRDHAAQFDGYSGKAGMLGIETFSSHADLQALLTERMTANREDPAARVDVVAMTAAVADYRPEAVYRILERRTTTGDTSSANQETWIVENVQAPKVKSTHDQIAVLGTRTLKLIDQFRTNWNYQGLLIKFKLEVGLSQEQLLQVAQASRLASHADLIVANTLAMARPTDGAEPTALLLGPAPPDHILRRHLPQRLVAWVKDQHRS